MGMVDEERGVLNDQALLRALLRAKYRFRQGGGVGGYGMLDLHFNDIWLAKGLEVGFYYMFLKGFSKVGYGVWGVSHVA